MDDIVLNREWLVIYCDRRSPDTEKQLTIKTSSGVFADVMESWQEVKRPQDVIIDWFEITPTHLELDPDMAF